MADRYAFWPPRLPAAPVPGWPRRLAQQLLGQLLPAACALCGGECAAVLCAACRSQFFATPIARCRICANPLQAEPQPESESEPASVPVPVPATERASAPAPMPIPRLDCCGRCLAAPPAFDATLAAAAYGAPVDQLVLQLKFGGRLALAGLFAQLLRDTVIERPDFVLPDLLCPVPLGPRRLAERGYNQALEIARPLSRALGMPLHRALAARVFETQAQSLVAPAERQRNIARAFVVSPDALLLVRGLHIGVVDDVMTSGQTLNELAATFKRYGAVRVSNLVLARTPPQQHQ